MIPNRRSPCWKRSSAWKWPTHKQAFQNCSQLTHRPRTASRQLGRPSRGYCPHETNPSSPPLNSPPPRRGSSRRLALCRRGDRRSLSEEPNFVRLRRRKADAYMRLITTTLTSSTRSAKSSRCVLMPSKMSRAPRCLSSRIFCSRCCGK